MLSNAAQAQQGGWQSPVVFLSQLLKINPRQFWRRATHHAASRAWTPAAWDEYLAQLAAPPAQPATQLPAPHTLQPPIPASCLEQPTTEAEIEVALQTPHSGRSGALLGYPSELLRYAKLVCTGADPAPEHLLLPCLQLLFNTAFLGHSAQLWKISLVTPTFKRGEGWRDALQMQLTTDQLQWANLSIGCMLASWFSAWSSTQSSKASVLPLRQATGQSTAPSIRHLCCSASLTNIDASSLHSTSALWTSNLHMTGYSGSCYGIPFVGWGTRHHAGRHTVLV